MELFFRKYFWVVNLAFLLAASYLSAKTVNVFVGAALAPGAEPQPATQTVALTQQVQKVALSPEALSKVTGIELPKVEEKAAEEAPPAPPDLESQEAVKTSLRVRLIGTMVANLPEWSLANIEDGNSKVTTVYMVGDKIQTAEIIEIELKRVLINNNGRKEYIDDELGSGEGHPLPVPQPPITVASNTNPPPSSAVGAGIKETGADTYEIPRDEINKALGNLNDIAMQARIVPAFKDGVSTGFKLFSIRPDSLYTKIGIQNGDIVRRINGFEINSPDKALEVYTKLKESNRIEIEVDRNGSAVRKTYNVR
ncbi:MAG: type II secretion system protein GspC [Myxococcales bacterium]